MESLTPLIEYLRNYSAEIDKKNAALVFHIDKAEKEIDELKQQLNRARREAWENAQIAAILAPADHFQSHIFREQLEDARPLSIDRDAATADIKVFRAAPKPRNLG